MAEMANNAHLGSFDSKLHETENTLYARFMVRKVLHHVMESTSQKEELQSHIKELDKLVNMACTEDEIKKIAVAYFCRSMKDLDLSTQKTLRAKLLKNSYYFGDCIDSDQLSALVEHDPAAMQPQTIVTPEESNEMWAASS